MRLPGRRSFRDAVVVITGAGSGIGRATAFAFAREGARLHVTDVEPDRIRAVAEELRALGAAATAHVVDSADPEAMERLAAAVFQAEGRVDVLHNNAGVGVRGELRSTTLEAWRRAIDVNLWGVIHGVHFFLPRMIAQGGGGHIVNTASGAGLVGLPSMAAYAATKFAIVGLSEVMNIELEPHGIHTTALCPGVVATRIVEECLLQGSSPEDRDRWREVVRHYESRGARPERVARDVLAAVRRRRPVQLSPAFPLLALWLLKRSSTRAYHVLMRRLAGWFARRV